MGKEWLNGVTKRLREELLLPRLAELRTRLEVLRSAPFDDFIEAATLLVEEIKLEFRVLVEIPVSKAFPEDLARILYAYTVSDFNSVMPSDHPYILAIANIRDEQRFCFACLYRERLLADGFALTPRAVPIVMVETAEDLRTGRFLEVVVAEGPDNVGLAPFE